MKGSSNSASTSARRQSWRSWAGTRRRCGQLRSLHVDLPCLGRRGFDGREVWRAARCRFNQAGRSTIDHNRPASVIQVRGACRPSGEFSAQHASQPQALTQRAIAPAGAIRVRAWPALHRGRLLAPPCCVLCGGAGQWLDEPWGLDLLHPLRTGLHALAQDEPLPFDSAFCLFRYRASGGPADHAAQVPRRAGLRAVLGTLFARALAWHRRRRLPECMVPLPLHRHALSRARLLPDHRDRAAPCAGACAMHAAGGCRCAPTCCSGCAPPARRAASPRGARRQPARRLCRRRGLDAAAARTWRCWTMC